MNTIFKVKIDKVILINLILIIKFLLIILYNFYNINKLNLKDSFYFLHLSDKNELE